MKRITVAACLMVSLSVTAGAQDTILQNPAPDTLIHYAYDTAALMKRMHFAPVDYDSLLASPNTNRKTAPFSSFHVEKRDLLLPGLCLLMLIYVTWLRYTYGKELRENFTVILNTNLGQQIYRDREFSANIFKFLTFINFALGGGMLVYLTTTYYHVNLPFNQTGLNVALMVMAVFALYLVKGFVYRFVGAVFNITASLRFFRFNALVIYHLLGIGLLPFILLAAFAEPPVNTWALFAALILVAIAIVLRVFKGLTVALSSGKLHILYFLLYICALEVAPLLIAIRLFDLWAGSQPK
ncbi:MAG TPA: DUF4271 domain-containing protein [Chitinophagales bacterium]|nr:DUF4271 domain-containing protein [Chitinophagales bacterium]HNA58523.1 DUF4271 domain-containing protein [Chitinophagales bacterium]HNF69427.1 DUF4271 domain-containing protein [Chitinophagales bacterium]HNJ87846.1 DUF4271 domain-containing protein [Chitinophagales bacterium]